MRPKKDPQRLTKIKPFINKCNWERINVLSEKDYWKKLDKNNITIALCILKRTNLSCLCFKI